MNLFLLKKTTWVWINELIKLQGNKTFILLDSSNDVPSIFKKENNHENIEEEKYNKIKNSSALSSEFNEAMLNCVPSGILYLFVSI